MITGLFFHSDLHMCHRLNPTTTLTPSFSPTLAPTHGPSAGPTRSPTAFPSQIPSGSPTTMPSLEPTSVPSLQPSFTPTELPTEQPTVSPSYNPTNTPTEAPTEVPTKAQTDFPTSVPTEIPSFAPTEIPSLGPTEMPSMLPTEVPTELPTDVPAPFTAAPTTTSMSFTLKSDVPVSKSSLLSSLKATVGNGVRIIDFRVQTSVPAEINAQGSEYDLSTPVGVLNRHVIEEAFALALSVPRAFVLFADVAAARRRRTALITILVETENDISVRWPCIRHALTCAGAPCV